MSGSESSINGDSVDFDGPETVKKLGFWGKCAAIAKIMGKSLKLVVVAVVGSIAAVVWRVGITLLCSLLVLAENFVVGVLGLAKTLGNVIMASFKTAVDILKHKKGIAEALENHFTPAILHLFVNSMIRTISVGIIGPIRDKSYALNEPATSYDDIFHGASRFFSKGIIAKAPLENVIRYIRREAEEIQGLAAFEETPVVEEDDKLYSDRPVVPGRRQSIIPGQTRPR